LTLLFFALRKNNKVCW